MAVRGIVLGSLPSVGSRLGLLDDEAHTLLTDRFSGPCKLPCTASRKVRLPRIGERCDAAVEFLPAETGALVLDDLRQKGRG
jgi:hypothetical protein